MSSKKYIPLVVRSTDGNCVRTTEEQYGSWRGAVSAVTYPCHAPPADGSNILYGDDTNPAGAVLSDEKNRQLHRFGLFADPATAGDKTLFRFSLKDASRDGVAGKFLDYGPPMFTDVNRRYGDGLYMRNEWLIPPNNANYDAKWLTTPVTMINGKPYYIYQDPIYDLLPAPGAVEAELRTIANNGVGRVPAEEQNNFVASLCGYDKPNLQYSGTVNRGITNPAYADSCKLAIASRPGKFDPIVNRFCSENPADPFCQCYLDMQTTEPKLYKFFMDNGLPLPSTPCWNRRCKNPGTSVIYQPLDVVNDKQTCSNITVCNQNLNMDDITTLAGKTEGKITCVENNGTPTGTMSSTGATSQSGTTVTGSLGAAQANSEKNNFIIYFLIIMCAVLVGVILSYVLDEPVSVLATK